VAARKTDKNEEYRLQSTHLKQRRAINDAYAMLLAQDAVQSFSSYTFEEALQDQLDKIENDDRQERPSELKRVERIEQSLVTAAKEIKKIPPDQFQLPNRKRDVNTTESGE